MPTNDERREVAARLRAIDDTEWTHPREELRALDEALGTAQGMPYALQTTWERFADLIEPEPERTCRMEHDERKRGVYCSHCGERMDVYTCDQYGDGTMGYSYPFCCECGAKVVSKCE